MIEKFCSEIRKWQEQFPQDKMLLQDLYYDAKYFHEANTQKFKGYLLLSGVIFGSSALFGKQVPVLMKRGFIFGTPRVARQLFYSGVLAYYLTHIQFNQQLEKTMDKIKDVYKRKEEEQGDLVRTKVPFLFKRKSIYDNNQICLQHLTKKHLNNNEIYCSIIFNEFYFKFITLV